MAIESNEDQFHPAAAIFRTVGKDCCAFFDTRMYINVISLTLLVHTIQVLDEITEENNSFQRDITRLRPILEHMQKVDILQKNGGLISTVQLNQGKIVLEQDDDDDEEERLVIPINSSPELHLGNLGRDRGDYVGRKCRRFLGVQHW